MKMSELAIEGGTPVRSMPWPKWPVFDEEDVEAVARVIRGGVWGSTVGTIVRDFEEAFADMHGAKFGVAVSSGTAALQVALMAVGVGPGDEVIVPAYTFVATATAALLVGAIPVFADIQPDTYNLDPDAAERAVTDRTKAILPVHFAGAIADMGRFTAIAEKYGLALIEDAAHAHAARRHDGKSPGSLDAAAACFSFQASKNLNAGEGGIILTDDEQIARTCRSLRNTGRAQGGAGYEHHLPGGNYRLTEMQGALLNSQLRRLPEQTRRRDANGRYLDERLSRIPGILPMRTDPLQELHPRHLYLFRYDAPLFGIPRERFLDALKAEGIPASAGYPIGLHHQPLYSGEGLKEHLPGRVLPHLAERRGPVSCPVTERACATEAVWLTQNLLLAEPRDMDDIVCAIKKIREAADV
jgi:dTDP-4-amino-4,6-dideoxygalactose transaminase